MSWDFGITVALITRTKSGIDRDGNDVYSTVETTIEDCAFDPGGSTELVQGQDMVITQPTLYVPAGTVVDSYAAFLINGQKFEVDGSPNDWSSPFTGWTPGVAIRLKRVTG
jgi:hypothetical protein